jgi:S1-C subfamily serine protease
MGSVITFASRVLACEGKGLQQYISQGASKGQRGGNLWLSEVFGAEIVIPSYNAVTVQLAGHDNDGDPVDSWGTGLVVDHNHIITNKHVVTGLAAPARVCPSIRHATIPTPNR